MNNVQVITDHIHLKCKDLTAYFQGHKKLTPYKFCAKKNVIITYPMPLAKIVIHSTKAIIDKEKIDLSGDIVLTIHPAPRS